jgi:hypothetical protein
MPTYRICTLGGDGNNFSNIEIAECTDDKEAVVRAIQAAASGFDVEVWDYKRFVARLPGNPLGNLLLTEAPPLIGAVGRREDRFMASAEDYRFYARRCLRWADETANADDRETLLEMANVWTKLELSSAAGSVSNGQSSPSSGTQGARNARGALRRQFFR